MVERKPKARKMSVPAYARHRGVTRAAVVNAVAEGRVQLTPDGKVDSVLADRQWKVNTKSRSRQANGTAPPGSATFEAARLSGARADLALLEFKRKSGELVSREDVRVEAFSAGRLVRDKLSVIGVRLGPVLAGTSDAHECVRLVNDAIRQALEDLAGQNGGA